MQNDTPTKTENDLALAIARWLEADGWMVYEEVSPYGNNSRRADLVARNGAIIWVIETKQNFSLDLLDQGAAWLPYAHFVSIGIWHGKKNVSIIKRVCDKFHLGLITVADHNSYSSRFSINQQCEGLFNRRANVEPLKKMLIDENLRSGNAGKSSHNYHTPYKMTVAALIKAVNDEPGISLENALRDKHHYKNDRKAKLNFLSILSGKKIPEIYYRIVRGQYLLYPTGYDENAVAVASSAELRVKPRIGEQNSLF